MLGYVVGLWLRNDDGSTDTELSRVFRSPSAAKEHAIQEMQENPNLYVKVLILECFGCLMDITESATPEYVPTGPEYIRRNGNGEDHENTRIPPPPSVTMPALSRPK